MQARIRVQAVAIEVLLMHASCTLQLVRHLDGVVYSLGTESPKSHKIIITDKPAFVLSEYPKVNACDADTSASHASGPATVLLLHAARKMQLVGDLDGVVYNVGTGSAVPLSLLMDACGHQDEQRRREALELACMHPRSAMV